MPGRTGSPPRARRFPRASALVLAAFLAALAACGGGGPTGGGQPITPRAPNLALITVTAPINGSAVISGSQGAVEGLVSVQITNLDATARAGGTPVRTTVLATQAGSFQTSIPAQLGDILEIVALRAGIASAGVTSTAGPAISSIQLRIVGGDQQVGVVNRTLTDSFSVQATIAQTQSGVPGLAIVFASETPGGDFSATRVVTNSQGTAASAYRLGPGEGLHSLTARLEVAPATQARGTAQAVGPPLVVSVAPATAAPGDTVTINGVNFSPIAVHNVVRFGTDRATVITAGPSSLVVIVPPFTASGLVSVTLTGITSNTVSVNLTPVVVIGRELGEVRLESIPPGGTAQIVLPFEDASQEFTLVVQSLEQTASLGSVSITGAAGTGLRALSPAARSAPVSGESFIRDTERELLAGLPRGTPAPPRALQPAQELGSTRQFFVVNKPTVISLTNPGDFDRVTATLRYRGANTLLYVDNRTGSTLTDVEIQGIGDRFDQQTYGIDVAAFGAPSDIDGNNRVIILVSPTVNALTTPEIMAQNARIVGFFFGIDLLPSPVNNPHANATEIFYAVAPNPAGQFTGARVTHEEIVDLLGSTFAHEFQHMINFNQRVLIRGASPEALWLDEGLSHMAETLNDFHRQNRLRSAFFLDSPHDVSLVAGGDDLDERGAAWLFVQYLVDRFGESVLGRLVQTSLASTTNVTAAAARPFATLFHEWSSTLMLDGPAISNLPIYEMPSVDLRGDFELSKQDLNRTTRQIGDVYLDPRAVTIPGATLALQQRGTSPLYVVVSAPGRANLPITISGTASAQRQVAVIRTR